MGVAASAFRSVADLDPVEMIPIAERVGERDVLGLIRRRASERGASPALIWLPRGRADDDPVVYSYAEFAAQVLRTANVMHQHGVGPGRPVSFLLPNLPQTHFMLWGGAAAGQVNPINPLLAPHQIAEIMAAAGSRVLVAAGPDIDLAIWDKACAVRAIRPEIECLLAVGDAPAHAGAISFDDAVRSAPADGLTARRLIDPDEVAAFFHTGGTTGSPKLAQQTHWNQVTSAWITAYALGAGQADRTLVGLPLFHANAALLVGLSVLSSGGAIVLAGQTGFRSRETMQDFWRIVDRHRVSIFSAVPTILSTLLDIPQGGADVSSLRTCFCGAAPLAVSLFKAFEEAAGVRILEAYGMTETLLATVNPRDGERRIGSVGVRAPYMQVKPAILDEEGAFVRAAETDETGVLLISGPSVTPGYKAADHNAHLWPEPGWLNSGDLGRRDAQGYLWLAGRRKDVIIRSGHNIDPATIEEALHAHPAVELAAAVGRPDAYAGELPVAYVSLRPGAIVDAETLKAFARANVPERPAWPSEVHILPRLPQTAVGKIFKPALRESAARDAVAALLEPRVAGRAHGVWVRAVTDPRRGLTVQIKLDAESGLVEEVREGLSRLALALEIERCGAAPGPDADWLPVLVDRSTEVPQ
jgi:fatty-acyl-CoA synthase